MTTPTTGARTWRALCPHCGAPVSFQSAASASAVCSFCRSTLVRDGEALRRIGTSADLIDDHSPLQLGAAGRLAGEPFTLVGRLQMGTAEGPWNEWRALFDNGREGWLSEDNGRYVFVFDAPQAPADAPDLDRLQPGAPVTVDGRRWDVASKVEARLLAAEGELRAPPPSDRAFTVADLRNAAGEVGTLAADSAGGLTWSVGRGVALSELAMAGLRESGEKTLGSQGVSCPNCGAPLTIQLASSQSVVCGQCKSVVDLSRGIGPDMAHYEQLNAPHAGAGPRLPLGRTGTIALGGPPLPWQVLGYVERIETEPDDDGTQTAWHEYLLHHPTEGFAFLVDTEDGWAWVKTLTGTPARGSGGTVTWDGKTFAKRWSYDSVVTYVLGEFYWRVEREQRTHHVDYVGRGADAEWQLNQESTGQEVTWSGGQRLAASDVARAFGLKDEAADALVRAAGSPPSFSSGRATLLVIFIAILLVVVLVAMCSRDECDDEKRAFGADSREYAACRDRARAGRSYGSGYGGGSGGSYGGWSSGGGGGHK